MVDRADLEKVSQLYRELGAITDAIGNLDAGGVIIAMTISGGPPVPPGEMGTAVLQRVLVQVPTTGWEYPAPMVTAIVGLLKARQEAIDSELAALGVTGEPEARAAP
jgi:hypothetical protein